MTQDEKPRSGYQERLLTELRALAERNAAEASPKPASRRGVARRPKLALTASPAARASPRRQSPSPAAMAAAPPRTPSSRTTTAR